MQYTLTDHTIETRALEVHITDHCNLRCAQCCSLSPHLPPWNIEPEKLKADLDLCKQVVKPRFLKLTGGEPLLHPQLIECLEIAKNSQLASVVSVTTNGLLLSSMQPEFWKLIDQLTLSVYPECGVGENEISLLETLMLQYDFTLNVKHQDSFQQMTPESLQDIETSTEIFAKCWLRHRCHMLRDSRFYLCTRAPHFDTALGHGSYFTKSDGLMLHGGKQMAKELLAYLQRSEPLEVCRRCRGGEASFAPHRQLSPSEQQKEIEELRCKLSLPAIHMD